MRFFAYRLNEQSTETMNEDQLKIKISSYISGNSSPEEARELLKTLSQDKRADKLYREMSASWAVASASAFARKEDENLQDIHQNMIQEQPAVRNRRRWWIAAAAAAVLLLASGNFYWWNRMDTLKQQYANVETPYIIKAPADSHTEITLPDGTTVTLNAGSEISYLRNFGAEERTVTLSGEALFDVAKNREKPFSVHVDELTVKVLGTKFNISGYEDDPDVTVSLLRGRVGLQLNNGNGLELHPNEQACYNKKTGQLRKYDFDTQGSSAWIDGSMHFENATFAAIAHRLEHRFGVRINVTSEQLRQRRFSGSFNKSQSLSDILHEIDIEDQYVWRNADGVVTISDK